MGTICGVYYVLQRHSDIIILLHDRFLVESKSLDRTRPSSVE